MHAPEVDLYGPFSESFVSDYRRDMSRGIDEAPVSRYKYTVSRFRNISEEIEKNFMLIYRIGFYGSSYGQVRGPRIARVEVRQCLSILPSRLRNGSWNVQRARFSCLLPLVK